MANDTCTDGNAHVPYEADELTPEKIDELLRKNPVPVEACAACKNCDGFYPLPRATDEND